jgi:RNA polymerase sigma factor (sigma-70 family)
MQDMQLAELAERCAQESSRFARGHEHDDRYCFEIFRRAIVEGASPAWAAIMTQYQGLVREWIWQHSLSSSIDDHDDLVARVFERFWQAVKPAKFDSFRHLASLLSYLKLCVFAAIIDEVRAQRSWQSHRAASELADEVEGTRVDEAVLGEIGHLTVWQTIEEVLTDPAERLVIYLSHVLWLKPREIARRQAQIFPSIEDVYRRKRSAMERLRRDPRLRAFWEGAAEA